MSKLLFRVLQLAVVVCLGMACTQRAKEIDPKANIAPGMPKDTMLFELENVPNNGTIQRKDRITASYFETLKRRQRNNYCKIRIRNNTKHDYQIGAVDSLIHYVNADFHSISEDAWRFSRICEWSVHEGYKSQVISHNASTTLYLPYAANDVDSAAVHLDLCQHENGKIRKGYTKTVVLYVQFDGNSIALNGVQERNSQQDKK